MKIKLATEDNNKHLRNPTNINSRTAFVCYENEQVIGILEYTIHNITTIHITHLHIKQHQNDVLAKFINELLYWHPYATSIRIATPKKAFIDSLIENDFFLADNRLYIRNCSHSIKVFKIPIEKILPSQLTIDQAKLKNCMTWVDKEKDIIVSLVKAGEHYICIDGHTRLLVGLAKKFTYVFGFLDIINDKDRTFYNTCRRWCIEEKILRLEDLENNIVSTKEHKVQWINRCTNYLQNN